MPSTFSPVPTRILSHFTSLNFVSLSVVTVRPLTFIVSAGHLPLTANTTPEKVTRWLDGGAGAGAGAGAGLGAGLGDGLGDGSGAGAGGFGAGGVGAPA